jgi:putative tryptophan/tyrosine transport system substrate-binding protein
MELLKASLPELTQVAILWDASAADQLRAAEAAARPLGLRVQPLELRSPSSDLPGAFAAAVKERAGAIFVVTSSITFRDRARIVQLATQNRLPGIFASREWAEAGGLMSYGANLAEMMRRAATYVDKILKGAKPGDLPVEQPTKFELVINLKTAKALGLTIPPSLLARADEVIQ